MKLIKPQKLNPGDTVAAITLSWGGASVFPYRYEIGKQRLKENFGLKVVETKHALKDADWIADNPKARADDLMEAFANPKIKAIFSIIGGDDSVRILPFINYNIIKQNPKIFLGFSDTTVSHFICLKAGISSFYGTSIMCGFSENVEMHNYSIQAIKHTLFSNETMGQIPENFEGWTKEHLDWSSQQNQNVKRSLSEPTGFKFISGTGKAQGRLIGGCVEVLEVIMTTDLWPEKNIWQDSILFLETSEYGKDSEFVEKFLHNLGKLGILNIIKGILFSKPGGSAIGVERFKEYDNSILKVIKEYGRDNLHIVTHMDFGHTDPMMVLPYGCLTAIDVDNKKISILENCCI